MLDTLSLPFVQRGLLEVGLLSLAGGLIGTWIVLRGLAFLSHAAGTAAFPGLVLADGLGFAPPLGAAGAAALMVGGAGLLGGPRLTGADSATALALVASLTVGIILASDVFGSGANVDGLLFGSLLLIDDVDLALAGAAGAVALAGTVALGPRWLAAGFDPAGAPALGLRSRVPDLALLATLGLAVVASLSAVGALLAGALLILPAAAARPWTRRLVPWQAASVGLCALEGAVGLVVSVELNAPPGATVAVLGGAVLAGSLAARALVGTRLGAAVPALR